MVFQRITGFKRITFCKRCNTKIINAPEYNYYCDKCLKKIRGHDEK